MQKFKIPFSVIMDGISVIEAENINGAAAKAKQFAIDGTLTDDKYVYHMEEDSKSISIQFNKIAPEKRKYIVSVEIRTLGKIKVEAKDSMAAEEIVEKFMEIGTSNEPCCWDEANEQKKILRVVEVY